jgi:hypothetical protein
LIHSKLKISPFVSLVCLDQEYFVYQHETGIALKITGQRDSFFALLDLCAKPRSKEFLAEFLEFSCKVCKRDASQVVDQLAQKHILIAADDTSEFGVLQNRWTNSGWFDALGYHLHCHNLPIADYSTNGRSYDDAHMKAIVETTPAPPLTLGNPSRPREILPPVSEYEHRSLHDLFAEPANYGRSGIPFSKRELSWMLQTCFGSNGFHEFRIVGKLLKKNIPSGGCRHPIEVFLSILDSSDTNPRVRYYNPVEHSLEDSGCFLPEDLLPRVFGPWSSSLLGKMPRLLLIVTGCFMRSMYRYRESRSYRVVAHDLGHALQNLVFVVRALDRRIVVSYSPPESILEPLVGANGLDLSVLAAVLIV